MCLPYACFRVEFCNAKFNIGNSVMVFGLTITQCDILAAAVFQHSIFIGFKRRRFKRLLNVNSQRAQIHSNIRKCGSDL